MKDESTLKVVTNPVLREALARIEKNERCSFPFWFNWGNWENWGNWGNWGNGWGGRWRHYRRW